MVAPVVWRDDCRSGNGRLLYGFVILLNVECLDAIGYSEVPMSEWNAETAEWYAEKYGEYATNRITVDALALDPDSVIVDVGCGTGAALRRAAEHVPRGKLIGVDPIPRMLEIAKERTASHPNRDRIEFRRGSAADLPCDDSSADVILAFDSFDHWPDKQLGLVEIRRVLRQNGRFVVVKDSDVPDGADTHQAFLTELNGAGFLVINERRITEDEVSFTMWVCTSTR
jgi:SAM-dependent methyltransferase